MRIGGEAPGRRAQSSVRLWEPGVIAGHRHLGSFWRPTTFCSSATKSFRPPCSIRGPQGEPCRYLAHRHKMPERNEQLARQRHDHGLARAGRILGSDPIPLCQLAILLEHQETPRELDHTTFGDRARSETSSIRCSGTYLWEGSIYGNRAARSRTLSQKNSGDNCSQVRARRISLMASSG